MIHLRIRGSVRPSESWKTARSGYASLAVEHGVTDPLQEIPYKSRIRSTAGVHQMRLRHRYSLYH